ncbi:hypothetical protein BX265_7657 [Streptomyces sp. TLI_235]|nr:hypothetical protein BX265_7657 [Streptomyces sp. TLI_235]
MVRSGAARCDPQGHDRDHPLPAGTRGHLTGPGAGPTPLTTSPSQRRHRPDKPAVCRLHNVVTFRKRLTTCRPCGMCAGGILRSGLGRVVLALSTAQLVELNPESGAWPVVAQDGPALFAEARIPVEGYYGR